MFKTEFEVGDMVLVAESTEAQPALITKCRMQGADMDATYDVMFSDGSWLESVEERFLSRA